MSEPYWVLVPVEVSEDMHKAAIKASNRATGNATFPKLVWEAMIMAADVPLFRLDGSARLIAKFADQVNKADELKRYHQNVERDMEGSNGLGVVLDRRFKPDDSAFDLLGKLLDRTSQLQMLWGLGEPGALVRFSELSDILFEASKIIQEQEVAAWALLSVQDPEITLDSELAAYWKRKGKWEVTELVAKAKE